MKFDRLTKNGNIFDVGALAHDVLLPLLDSPEGVGFKAISVPVLGVIGRIERFKELAEGFKLGNAEFKINQHLINSVQKSGRRHIDVNSMMRALGGRSVPGNPGSRIFTDAQTGTRFFVNEANEVVGTYPAGFK